MVYPDGHPWQINDVKALMGAKAFASAPLFAVDYYKDGNFAALAKESVTPMIDFDLGTEPGTGSPDASAGVPRENFSVRWTGTILPPANGTYIFYVNGDNQVRLYVNSKLVLNKESAGTGEVSKDIQLPGNQRAELKIEYIHAGGDPCLHVAWSGPGLQRQVLTPINNASVRPN